jgi:hypothetical protein
VQNGGAFAARGCVVCSHGHYTAQRTLVSSGWKLNRTWHSGFWDFADTELYHIETDPRETTNCAATEPARVLDLMRKMRQWLDQYQPDHADPLARIACDEPPGFIRAGHELRARVRRGELAAPESYHGRWT